MNTKYLLAVLMLFFACQMPAWADNKQTNTPATAPATTAEQKNTTTEKSVSWWQKAQNNISATWASNEYEIYLPLRTWHNRSKYSREKIKEFNEEPWGLGVGKVRDDDKGNTHSIFAIVFADSHNDPETLAGYAWQKNWRISQNQKVSLGAFGGLTSRSDIMHYVPFPVAWPYVSYSYRKLSIQGMYFPGSKGNGNIAFFWARYRF